MQRVPFLASSSGRRCAAGFFSSPVSSWSSTAPFSFSSRTRCASFSHAGRRSFSSASPGHHDPHDAKASNQSDTDKPVSEEEIQQEVEKLVHMPRDRKSLQNAPELTGDTAEIERHDPRVIGLEQLEEEGVTDVDGPSVLYGPFGTREKPVEVLSWFNSRIVGCQGGPGDRSHELLWHEVTISKPVICLECGQFFVLKPNPYRKLLEEEHGHDEHGHEHDKHGHGHDEHRHGHGHDDHPREPNPDIGLLKSKFLSIAFRGLAHELNIRAPDFSQKLALSPEDKALLEQLKQLLKSDTEFRRQYGLLTGELYDNPELLPTWEAKAMRLLKEWTQRKEGGQSQQQQTHASKPADNKSQH